MGLLDTLIITSCMGMQSGQPQDACQKALQAGTKQSGVEKVANDQETAITKKADTKAKDLLGEQTYSVVGGTVFLAKTVSEKKVSLGLPTMGICNSIKAEVSDKQSQLKLEWKF